MSSNSSFFNNSNTYNFKKVSHVIFDVDGLLLDTETLYTEAIQNILDNFGKQYTWEIKVQSMGMVGHEMAKLMVDRYDLPIPHDEFSRLLHEQYLVLFPHCKFMPGAERLIKHLHSLNVPIAIATSSNRNGFEIKVQNHKDVISLFDHMVCGSDPEVKRGKPNPDIFLVCAAHFPDKPKPEDCLVFEDSYNGVLAAKRANMQCVMVPDERLSSEFRKDATLVIKSLNDFKPELFGLPPFS